MVYLPIYTNFVPAGSRRESVVSSTDVGRSRLAGSSGSITELGATAESDDHLAFAASVQAAVAAAWTDEDLQEVGSAGQVVDEELHWQLLVDLGLPAVPVGEDRGGFGGTWLDVVGATERVGAALLPQPMVSALAANALLMAGGEIGADLLASAASGRKTLTVVADCCARSWSAPDALTVRCDEGSGSTPVSPGTRIAITGRVERFLRPGADTLLVPVATSGGTIVVSVDSADIELSSRIGLDLLRPIGSAVFTATPASVVLDASTAPYALEKAHAAGVLALTSESVGVCQRALDRATAYAKEREQFGKPIGSFQAIAHRLADVFVETELARTSARHLAAVLDAGLDPQHAEDLAHHQGVHALQIASASLIQVLGGIGFTWESAAHHIFRRAGAEAVLFGSAEAQLHSRSADQATAAPLSGPAAELAEFVETALALHREKWGNDTGFAARRDWQRRMHTGGWNGLGWPAAFGGKALTIREQVECERVLATAGAPGPAGILGINNV
jgi:alkylation response protein AidB-like acyl-CoA dehydrogenase